MRLNRRESLLYGATLPLRSLALIVSRPRLLFWSTLPVALTLLLYFYGIARAQDWVQGAISGILGGWGLHASHWLSRIILILSRLVLIIAGVLTFSLAATVIASPFNDFLAEASERHSTPVLPAPPRSGIVNRARLITLDVAKSVAATVAGLLALGLSWVPAVNVLSFALAFLLVTFQFISYPQTRRGQGIGRGALFLWSHFYACLGMGAVISVLFAIPLVSCVCVPLAVVSGTLLFARAPGHLR